MPFSQPYVANPYPYAYAQTLTSANILYEFAESLVAGVYTISWSGGGTLTIYFYNGTTLVGTTTGTSSITFNLAGAVTNYKMWNTVGNTSVVISLSGLALAPVTGTVYSYSTSQTITQTGNAWAVIVGAGGGGAGGQTGGGAGGGGGGGSGSIVNVGALILTGSQVLTVGTAGTGGGAGVAGGIGGTTTFLSFSAAGGGGGGAGGAGGAAGGAGAPGGLVLII